MSSVDMVGILKRGKAIRRSTWEKQGKRCVVCVSLDIMDHDYRERLLAYEAIAGKYVKQSSRFAADIVDCAVLQRSNAVS